MNLGWLLTGRRNSFGNIGYEPKAIKSFFNSTETMAMQYRRRSSRADGAVMRAASAGAAVEQLALEDAAAVAVPSSPAAASAAAADLQLVGQELVPVIQGQAATGASVEMGMLMLAQPVA